MIRNSEQERVRGTLVLVSADNLAAHSLGGYRSLSSSIRRCRHCMATAEETRSKVRNMN